MSTTITNNPVRQTSEHGIVVPGAVSLPALVRRAAQQLEAATTAAEVLDAKDAAALAYDTAKAAARFARAKQAHDDVLSAVYRAQADALEIEAQAKRRLADEYDAAQERGEVRTQEDGKSKGVPVENALPAAADLGLTRKDIHEARQVRDAEAADPGIVRRVLDAAVQERREPTRAEVRRAVAPVAQSSVPSKRRSPIDHEIHRLAMDFVRMTKRIDRLCGDDRLEPGLERATFIGEFARAHAAVSHLYVKALLAMSPANVAWGLGVVCELRAKAEDLDVAAGLIEDAWRESLAGTQADTRAAADDEPATASH